MPAVLSPDATSHDLAGNYKWLDERAASYIRIASVSIAAYDYLLTLPAEWRFYKSQKSWRVSTGCILFVLIRYISIVVLVINTVGYFAWFSPATCARYFWVGPIFKVTQTMLSQIILGIRYVYHRMFPGSKVPSRCEGFDYGFALVMDVFVQWPFYASSCANPIDLTDFLRQSPWTVNISRRSLYVTVFVAALFAIITTGESFTALFHRTHIQDYRHNCTVGEGGLFLSAWLYYLAAMIYDLVMLCVSTFYLVRFKPIAGRMSGLVRLMLYDGLGYFVVLTGSNILNLVIYRTSDSKTQSSCAVIGEAVTWIMSQKLLIHLRDAAADAHRSTRLAVSHTRTTPTGTPPLSSNVPFSVRSKTRSTMGGDGDVLAWSGTSLTDLVGNLSDVELDLQDVEPRTEGCVAVAAEEPCVVWAGSIGSGEPKGGGSEKEKETEGPPLVR